MANGFGLTGLVRMMLWPSLKHSLLFALLMRPAQLSGGNGAVASFWLGTRRLCLYLVSRAGGISVDFDS